MTAAFWEGQVHEGANVLWLRCHVAVRIASGHISASVSQQQQQWWWAVSL